jgi:hypothetical protein
MSSWKYKLLFLMSYKLQTTTQDIVAVHIYKPSASRQNDSAAEV